MVAIAAVPGLLISPYARKGYIDHQILSFDAYLKFIEDDFLDGQRLDPRTDGRPDPRPEVREDTSILGDLAKDFDFRQAPRPPLVRPTHPTTALVAPSSATPGRDRVRQHHAHKLEPGQHKGGRSRWIYHR